MGGLSRLVLAALLPATLLAGCTEGPDGELPGDETADVEGDPCERWCWNAPDLVCHPELKRCVAKEELDAPTCSVAGFVTNLNDYLLGGLTVVLLDPYDAAEDLHTAVTATDGSFLIEDISCDRRSVAVVQPELLGSGEASGSQLFSSSDPDQLSQMQVDGERATSPLVEPSRDLALYLSIRVDPLPPLPR